VTGPRSVLICHHDAPLHREGLARWLGSWSDVRGIMVIAEPPGRKLKRVGRERRRVGILRLADVVAMRLYYRAILAKRDEDWVEDRIARLAARYPPVDAGTPVITVSSPNSPAAEEFLRDAEPDFALALCKNILAERVFTIPRAGTFVLHPGVCPEYRNAHGCFWALARNDLGRVGMTLLRVDRGIDTGAVFGYFTADFDELRETHVVIQHRMVLDNLEPIAAALRETVAGCREPVSTAGRESREWGQPWLTSYLAWKRAARRRRRARGNT
jgi:hypothetical protein